MPSNQDPRLSPGSSSHLGSSSSSSNMNTPSASFSSTGGAVLVPGSQATSSAGETSDLITQGLGQLGLSTPSSSRSTTPSGAVVILTPFSSPPAGSAHSHRASPRDQTPSAIDMTSVAAALPLLDGTPTRASPSQGSSNLLAPNTPPAQRGESSSNQVSNRTRSPRGRRSNGQEPEGSHEVGDEVPPDDPFHNPGFQALFRDIKTAMSELGQVLTTNSLHLEPDTTMRRLFQEARELSEFECSATRTLGFVGDSGVGKSSLLNSLLDIEGLARTSNSGSACTCVVTEYHYHASPDFVIDIDWFTMDEVETQLNNLLESYRHYHINGEDMTDGSEKEECEADAAIAESTFEALFPELLQSDDFAIALADPDSESPELSVLAQMMREVENLARGFDRRPQRFPGSRACSVKLSELTSQPAGSQAALWPLIKKIKVYLNAHILGKGLVLVDLPGLRDRNSARRNITERFILEMDEIFAVCNIGRAVTDQGVQAVIDLAQRARLSNVGIICTKSDDIQAEECRNDPAWTGERKAALERHIEAIDVDEEEHSNVEAELSGYPQTPEELELEELSLEEREELRKLHMKERSIRDQLRVHRFELQSYLVRARNEIVTDELREHYEDRIPGDSLKVFCISNTTYWTKRNQPKSVSLKWLQLSGIIDVRRHCISIVSARQLASALAFIKGSVPALVSSLQTWVESGSGSLSAERKKVVREALTAADRQLHGDLVRSDCRVRELQLDQLLRDNITRNQAHRVWREAATLASQEWRGWHHSTYSAFCRNYGNYSTPTVQSHDWNAEATEKMRADMEVPWENLRNSLAEKEDVISEAVASALQKAIEHLRPVLDDPEHRSNALIELLASRKRLLRNELGNLADDFEKDLSLLETDSMSVTRTSFVGKALEPAYRACNFESGRGSDARRKNIIDAVWSDRAFFPNWHQRVRERYQEVCDKFEGTLREQLHISLGIIQQDMDMLMNENVALESEKDPEFRSRVERQVSIAKDRLEEVDGRLGELGLE